MVIITGTGRSGTSLLAQWCSRAGYRTGGRWHEAINAGMEWSLTARMARRIARHGLTDSDRQLMAGIRRHVIKDPRLCIWPRVMQAWVETRRDLFLVIALRDATAVARSLHADREIFARRDPKLLTEQVEETASRRARAAYEAIRIAAAAGTPMRILSYPEFLDQYDRVHEAFTAGGLEVDYERGRAIWDELVDRKKVHQQGDDSRW